MQRINFLATVCLWSFLSCAAAAQSFSADRNFWFTPGSTAQCRTSYNGLGNYTLSVTLTRRPYPNDDGPNFAGHYGMWLADTIAGRRVAEHKRNILSIAQADVFTRPNMTRGWSPIYVQSSLLKITAMYIKVMEARGQLTSAERSVLFGWGDKMIPGQKGSRGNSSADSRMASGVAMMAWGEVKNDTGLMRSGYRKFMSGYDYVLTSVGRLGRHPAHRSIPVSALSLEDEYNVALQHAVEGVAILRNLGFDLSSRTKNGVDLHKAVSWWASIIAKKPRAFQGYRAWSHNFHLGWIPIYLSKFPNQPAAAQLKSIARDVTRGRSPSFRAISLAGATDCLW